MVGSIPAAIDTPRRVVLLVALLALICATGIGVGWVTNASDGYFGISRVDTAPDAQNALVIRALEVGSPADRAGLLPGDVIIAVDGEERVPGSRARWVGIGNAPGFQTRPLAIPPADAPLFRRTAGERKPGQVSTLRIQRPSAQNASPLTVTVVAASKLASPQVVLALVTWHLVALLTLLVSAVVILRRPSDIAARLLMAAAGCLSIALVLLSWDNRPLPNVIAFVAQFSTAVLLVAGSSSLLHLWLAFPSPSGLLARLGTFGPGFLAPFGRAASAIYVLPLSLTAALYLGPASFWPWSYLIVIVLLAFALCALLRSILRPPTPVARAQLKWIGAPLIVGLTALALGPGVTAVSGARAELLAPTAAVAAWLLFPVGIAIAVLRYRLFDIELVLRAATLFPLLIALLAGAYLATTQTLVRSAVSLLGPAAVDNFALSTLAALIVAAASHPVYVRLQTGLDRLLYPRRLARQRLIEDSMALQGPVSNEDVASFLTQRAVGSLALAKAWLVLPDGVTTSDRVVASNLLLSADLLLERMNLIRQPTFVLRPDELVLAGPNALSACDPALASWHSAGARLLLPLRGRSAGKNSGYDGLLGVWLLGARRNGSFPDSEDVNAAARIARQASVLLDNDRLHRQEAAESERNARFRRYFSPQIAELISAQHAELATHRRELTVLFAQLRGLGALNESVEPEELVHHLGEFVDVFTAAIFEHGGTLDKCLGEGIIAFFGDPMPQADHASRALRAAMQMHARLGGLKESWASGAAQVDLAVGLASGWVTAGTIGPPARQEYAVVGHAVSLAARLAAAAEAGEVLLTDKTRRLLTDDVALVPRGEVVVEGRLQPVPIFGCTFPSRPIISIREPTLPVVPVNQPDAAEAVSDITANADLLAGAALFASLPHSELQSLASQLRLRRFKKGEIILSGLEDSTSFFLIRSGTVKVSRALVSADEAVISILGRGEFFGELALFEGQGADSTVVALQPTETLVLSRDVFIGCLQAYPTAASAAMSLLAQRIQRLNDQLEEAYALELPQRLARRLLALGSVHGKKTSEGLVIDLSLTQSELAGMVGASRQRVNRILAVWQDRRVLRLGSYGRITLLSPAELTDIAPESLVG